MIAVMFTTDSGRAHKRFVWIASLVTLAIFAVAVWVALVLLEPTPPRTVVMTTGTAGSAYAEFGERYRDVLAREGIELRLLPSAGAVENLARLRDPDSGVSVGFVQGGTTDPEQSPDLAALGTLTYEPLWFFYRDVDMTLGLPALRGKKISIGLPGSGTRELATELLRRNGVDRVSAEWVEYSAEEAGEKLLGGEIHAALMVTSWESPVVRRLLTSDDVNLLSFPRADAYVALYPFLSKLVLPAGVGDLARNLPPTDVLLLAPKASLAVREDLHPAIQYLLLEAAAQIHGRPGIFHKEGQFPAPESIDLPLSEPARQFYTSGSPFLQRYLPFWMAALVRQIFVLLIPLVGVLYPVLRLGPAAYDWAMRRRIFRQYTELKLIESQLDQAVAPDDVAALELRLNRLEDRVNHAWVPAGFAHMLYTLRVHIGLVRARFEKTHRPQTAG
jgi:TRAP-type uncharacterized transport system substrate-binding protein